MNVSHLILEIKPGVRETVEQVVHEKDVGSDTLSCSPGSILVTHVTTCKLPNNSKSRFYFLGRMGMTHSEGTYENIELTHLAQCVIIFLTYGKNPGLESLYNFPNSTGKLVAELRFTQICRLQSLSSFYTNIGHILTSLYIY